MKNKNKLLIIALLLMSFFILGTIKISLAQDKDDIDAIGVRILPNPNHYSISRWYQKQGFYGSPQALIVDGYEAIRDGRTVYVNAANVIDKKIYTNIYMISYNQDPSQKTVDILGQIVSRWKFNSNLETTNFDNPAFCSISSTACSDDSDCDSESFCSTSGKSIGSCQLKEMKNCLIDSDCPSGFFCDSEKAKITRDVKRISLLDEIREALANYYRLQGSYPLLSSGTYLINKSVSVWPSWQQNFLNEIAISPNFIDPINSLGNCPGFDAKTCWNATENKFYSQAEGNNLPLPANSYAMVYSTDSYGANYKLCSVLESRHPSLNYTFATSDQSNSACVVDTGIITEGTQLNRAPELVDYNLSGQLDKEFNGFIKVNDLDGDVLEWRINIDKSKADWSNWSSDALQIIDTSNKFQKKIYATKAGLESTNNGSSLFPINLQVSDNRGGVLSRDLMVDIQDQGIFIEAQNASHVLDKRYPLSYSFYVSGDNLTKPFTVSFRKITGPELPAEFFDANISLASQDRYQISYQSHLNPSIYKFPENTNFEFEIVVKNNNKEFKKRFDLQLISEKPILEFNCPLKARLGEEYVCSLGDLICFNQCVSYKVDNQPKGLSLKYDNNSKKVYLTGKIDHSSNVYQITNNVVVTATSDYGASISKSFNLVTNSFCGDGIIQSPNAEERGGALNDGYEQCDGIAGTTNSPAESSAQKQYACSTKPLSITPSVITNKNHCVFAGILDGGGYCGDKNCQSKNENKLNCPQDCSDNSATTPQNICQNNSDCESWQTCNVTLSKCELAPGFCEQNYDCSAGFNCNVASHKCVSVNDKICNIDSDCESWQICSADKVCKVRPGYCETDADCNDGNVCNLNSNKCEIDCPSTAIDSRDNNFYPVIALNNQCWINSNMKYLPKIELSSKSSNSAPLYYVYGYVPTWFDEATVAKAKSLETYKAFGTLYNYKAAETACPSGWRLPTSAEYTALLKAFDKDANKLKSKNQYVMKAIFHWNNPPGEGDNASGFQAYPAGFYSDAFSSSNRYDGHKTRTCFWSSTASSISNNHLILNLTSIASTPSLGNSVGCSVRCVKE